MGNRESVRSSVRRDSFAGALFMLDGNHGLPTWFVWYWRATLAFCLGVLFFAVLGGIAASV